jgi:hypothetical protein
LPDSTNRDDPLSEEHDDDRSKDERRARILLALGAAVGLVLAALGVLRELPGDDALPGRAIARVEGALIERDDFHRLVAGYEKDTRAPSDAEDRRRILDRMIEEELLIARALELGLGHLDRKVRADLTAGLITSIVSEYDEGEPSDSELRAHYKDNRAYFAVPGRLRVRQMSFLVQRGAGEASSIDSKGKLTPDQRADAARTRLLAGEDWDAVKRDLATPEIFPLPDALLPAQKLREYVGPTVVQAALSLEVGDRSEPIRSGAGVHLIEMIDREEIRSPALAEIQNQVASDWRRRQGDAALRRYIDDLRANADVEIAAEMRDE